MSHSDNNPFSYSYHSNHVADDSSTLFDADTVISDEVPSLPAMTMPPLPTLIATAATTDYQQQQPNNNNETISSSPHSSQEESPANTISELLRRNQSSSSSSPSQTSTTKELTKHELKWRSKFQELCAYKQLHGHTNFPTSNKELGDWVLRQRHEYKKFKANKKAYITKERIEMLESIDFEWVNPNQGQRNESLWNEHFNELKAYKEEYNDTNVPARWEDNKELGNWVGTQRAEYKKFKANKKAFITKKRIQTLESIGFEWVVSKKYPRKESKWNERFTELLAYKELHGHTNVPTRCKQLGNWVSTQRYQYKKFQENKKTCITPERIDLLNSIGFQWECLPGPAPRF